MSSDSMTLHSMTSQYEQMDPEIRAQIRDNIHALYEASIATQMHIATSRSPDGTYLAFLVQQGQLVKALSNPNALASEPKGSRNAAMISLLEATEQRIADTLLNTSTTIRANSKKDHRDAGPRTTILSPADNSSIHTVVDYGEKPKMEKGFMWRRHAKVESAYAKNV